MAEILETPRAAPSNFNSQPWRVYLLVGRAKNALGEAISRAYRADTTPLFSPLPQPMPNDCAKRVDDFGRRYYSALGIDRSDVTARARQTGRNYVFFDARVGLNVFFDAPVGLIFTTLAPLTKHSWLDCGLFLQSFLLAAHVRGLAPCPQVSFVRFQSIIAEQLGLEADEVVTRGVSCGRRRKSLSAIQILHDYCAMSAVTSAAPFSHRELKLSASRHVGMELVRGAHCDQSRGNHSWDDSD